jgi:hypothetical protein
MIKQAQLWAIGLGQEKEKANDRFEDNDAHFPLIHTDSNPRSQDTRSSTTTSTSFSPSTITGTRRQKPFQKRILIIDDDPDITLTFKAGLEDKSKNFKFIPIMILYHY